MKEYVLEPSVELIESMRAVGYSMEAAVADIVDNSVDAHATQIQIDLDVVAGGYIAILDNGEGMTAETAFEALRFAGTAGQQEKNRLGRFGLGLKTASLSQARTVTVVTKQENAIHSLRWSIDHVKSSGLWKILAPEIDEIDIFPFKEQLMSQSSGTVVIWTQLDLLLGDSTEPGAYLAAKVSSLQEHLGLTFHRFLESRNENIDIRVNGLDISPIDPFLTANPKTQHTPKEDILIGSSKVSFTSFTLPHPSGLTANERSRFDLADKMREFQGFYLYRNRRLLTKGNWFGLAPMNELTKQTRIMVDIPQNLDNLWQVDIKKSQAEPPTSFRTHLKRMIEPLLEKGRRVHTYRGRARSSSEVVHVWNKFKERNGFKYEVNLENPAIASVIQSLKPDDADSVVFILKLLAETFPYLDVYQEQASNQLPINETISDEELRIRLARVKASGVLSGDLREVLAYLKTTEPFAGHPRLEEITKEIWSAK